MRFIRVAFVAAAIPSAGPALATPTFAPFVSYPASPFARVLRVADLDRDADLDVVMGTIADGEALIVYFNDGNGGFSTLPTFLDFYPMSGGSATSGSGTSTLMGTWMSWWRGGTGAAA